MLKNSNDRIPRSKEERDVIITKATKSFEQVLTDLGYSWQDDPNMSDTPHRYIKSMVNELCVGNYSEEPKITTFDNIDGYDGIVAQCNVELHSLCAHHLLSFSGVAHVGYIPDKKGKVIGLSKLNRIVEFFARRPQVQENLTMQILNYISEKCVGNHGVIVIIQANHTCCSHRGVGHSSTMVTTKVSGFFDENKNGCKDEFYKMVEFSKK